MPCCLPLGGSGEASFLLCKKASDCQAILLILLCLCLLRKERRAGGGREGGGGGAGEEERRRAFLAMPYLLSPPLRTLRCNTALPLMRAHTNTTGCGKADGLSINAWAKQRVPADSANVSYHLSSTGLFFKIKHGPATRMATKRSADLSRMVCKQNSARRSTPRQRTANVALTLLP